MILGNASLKKYNTLRLESRADFFVQPKDEDELRVFIDFVNDSGTDVIVLGGGSNVVFTKERYSAAVCVLNTPFYKNELIFGENKVSAFEHLASLIKRAKALEPNNLVHFSGIPGTVGGALACNAGTKDVWFSQFVTAFDCIIPNGEKRHFTEYASGYRTAELGCPGGIITDVYLNISEISPEEEYEIKSHILNARKRQPLNMPSAGSVFKNPAGQSAGELIEKAGLKGSKIGGAMVSDMHANFIVNAGNAAPSDVTQLISLIQNKVKEQFNIQLELEVRLI